MVIVLAAFSTLPCARAFQQGVALKVAVRPCPATILAQAVLIVISASSWPFGSATVSPIPPASFERVPDFRLVPDLSGPQSPSSPNVRKICHQLPLPSSHARRHIVPGSL